MGYLRRIRILRILRLNLSNNTTIDCTLNKVIVGTLGYLRRIKILRILR